ncbi:uncharacterized protein LOC5515075 isoform X3 [Nematostella vectensis]|uniref:uncharacterized protein LOC5515075 isoform X3 n=1 Tax=Nematostella vectensis TaxID=45351 RepID=UPI002076DDC3|nr:uncharacterized protein LOC5515075 isoform X3 [Nematostella vectensis]
MIIQITSSLLNTKCEKSIHRLILGSNAISFIEFGDGNKADFILRTTQEPFVDWGVIVESIFLCVLMVVIIFGNTLVCLAFYRNRKLRTTTNCFLCSLAAADIAVGVFSVPYWVYFRLASPVDPNGIVYRIYITYDIICGTASIINLVTISLERCLSVTQPAIHRNVSPLTIGLSIGFAWVYAIVVASLTHVKESQMTWYPIFVSIASFFLPLFIILVNYLMIHRVARRRARARHLRSLKREIRIAVTLAVVIIAFILTWLPFFVILLFSRYCSKCEVPYRVIVPLVKWMHYSGSMVNPIIYTYRNRDFKRAFIKILCGHRKDINHHSTGKTRQFPLRSKQSKNKDLSHDGFDSKDSDRVVSSPRNHSMCDETLNDDIGSLGGGWVATNGHALSKMNQDKLPIAAIDR